MSAKHKCRARTIAACLLAALMTLPTAGMAVQMKDGNYLLTPVEIKACADGNGCLVMPTMALEDALQRAGESGYAQGLEAGGKQGYRAGLDAGRRSCTKGWL